MRQQRQPINGWQARKAQPPRWTQDDPEHVFEAPWKDVSELPIGGLVTDLPQLREPCTCPEVLRAYGYHRLCPACQAWQEKNPLTPGANRRLVSAEERLAYANGPQETKKLLATMRGKYNDMRQRLLYLTRSVTELEAQRDALRGGAYRPRGGRLTRPTVASPHSNNQGLEGILMKIKTKRTQILGAKNKIATYKEQIIALETRVAAMEQRKPRLQVHLTPQERALLERME